MDSVASPDGTMTHTARGFASLPTSSARVKAPSAPSVMISRVFSGGPVVGDDAVLVEEQAPDHVGAHAAESNEAECPSTMPP